MHGDLLEARDIMFVELRTGGWNDTRDMLHVVLTWEKHREALARTVVTQGFHDVAGAFKVGEFVQLIRERNTTLPDQGFALATVRMKDGDPPMRCSAAGSRVCWLQLVGGARDGAPWRRARNRS